MAKFTMAYSLGKDSALALHRMIDAGNDPVCLLTMFKEDAGRSWFHGADQPLLSEMEKALEMPIKICTARGENYAGEFEKGLGSAKEAGADFCAFGDIDLEANRKWEEDRCANAGLLPVFPLWQQKRASLLEELLKSGFQCLIKTIRLDNLPVGNKEREEFVREFLGKPLDSVFIREITRMGLDACGENGEYHTLAVNGPIFKKPLHYKIGKVLFFDNHAAIEIKADK